MSRQHRKRRQQVEKKQARKRAQRGPAPAPTPYAGQQVPLERIDDVRWRVPRTGAMRTDGIVYAREELLPDLREDRCLEQVANVATLPGIVGSSLAMPDIHWGYGFPIGGVAAFDPDQGGVVSPGGVGYDINCLSGDTPVLTAEGCTRPIAEIVQEKLRGAVAVFDLGQKTCGTAAVVAGIARPPKREVVELRTRGGRTLVATVDHPVLTPSGMRELGTLGPGDQVASLGFDGVPWEPPQFEVLVSEADIRQAAARNGKTDAGRGLTQALNHLRPLLPLTTDHPALPVLLKVAGYVLGDGAIYFESDRLKGRVIVNGQPEDLERMSRELRPWLRTSPVYTRPRDGIVNTTYGPKRAVTIEHSMRLGSTGLALLLHAMGLPIGRRPEQDWGLPAWLERAPRWHQRLFLAGFFGAELSTPATVPGHGTCFTMPALCQNRRPGKVESGVAFLEQLATMLHGFGVTAHGIAQREEQTNADGSRSTRLRLELSSKPESLLALWGRVGFEFNAKRSRMAAWAVSYLRQREAAVGSRELARVRVRELRERHGWAARQIHQELLRAGFDVNRRFVERVLYEKGRDAPVRAAATFPRFGAWVEKASVGLERSGVTWDPIVSITPRSDVATVHDITVDHPSHDFVAGGLVVHNCGVRMLSTDLRVGDVRPRLRELVETLFEAIPSGVGSTRPDLQLGERDLDELMEQGLGWALERGLATEEDLERVEERGRIAGARPDAVSHRARSRGRGQVGTLGSGNHFAEVGWVDEVYDESAAEAFGLRRNQVTVMIHSGSRGLGHQVCEDALGSMLHAAAEHGIELVDRQLCCAPIGSDVAKDYLAAMASAANFAFVNRQVMAAWTRDVFRKLFKARLTTVYDVCHNIAKLEEHEVAGVKRRLLVHRKGATRALAPGHATLPAAYAQVGQPVIIPGDMGRYSFVLKGAPGSGETFGSACHGAGRLLSRGEAQRRHGGEDVVRRLADEGVIVRGASRATVVEEVPEAYKDVAQVVDVVHQAGIAGKVARIRPIGVVKG